MNQSINQSNDNSFIHSFIYLFHHTHKLHEKKENKTNTHQCKITDQKKRKQKRLCDHISNINKFTRV